MKTETKRGRPRKFDEDVTLDQVMQVFWRNGYAATSLDQIAEATGLNRPSLYAAFGSKKDMYLNVISRFADRMHVYLAEAGQQTAGANPRLKAILIAAIDLYTGQTDLTDAPYGCLAISTLQTESPRDSEFKEALTVVIARMDKGFASLIRHETKGSMTEQEICTAAQHLALILHGLSIRARAGETPDVLKRLAESAVDKIIPFSNGN
ncbi:AcrR family transcriptional regulator [Labrenzia sp. EL_13]|uniref:TetR/AcrR family transcriptional regulator n=1 Tax=Roseibium album TaxID=311410 RepID=UPI000CF1407D|nr:AcrR family transcriptional regulator [Labrenzia sp. EL_142]MBG6156067.1 AcrR family transcriptional regulator [Labrenzia sp. EL_162]MBG6194600.1 AcrR family transcriptional regulator [Labrenzia sp. EL_159]MBG6200469.1 AcrR family transcriptional regulator [Labrenzia sp. EL_13]MCR9060594.1 TetR/AcrR family transcriptional regulator [Paracoccaceae bacterium]